MNLLTRKTLVNLPFIFIILLGSSLLFYQHLKNELDKNVNEALEVRKKYISKEKDNLLRNKQNILGNNIFEFHQNDKQELSKSIVSDTLLFDELHNDYLPYRQMRFALQYKGKMYTAYVREVIVDYIEILETVTFWIFIESLAIALILSIFNSLISRKVMRPMYNILKKLSLFDIESKVQFPTTETDIKEFKDLNESLINFTKKIQQQYLEMKEFTSHFTHELQTPLAIIKAQTDMLMQDEKLDESQLQALDTIRRTTLNISKFENTLIFIKEIEIGEYINQETINLKECIDQKLIEIEELLSLKNITLKTQIKDQVEIHANPILIDALLNNIISNAVRHNHEGGDIEIVLSNNGILSVENSCLIVNTSQAKKPKRKGLGMGLNIIKTICKRYSFVLRKVTVNNDRFLIIVNMRQS